MTITSRSDDAIIEASLALTNAVAARDAAHERARRAAATADATRKIADAEAENYKDAKDFAERATYFAEVAKQKFDALR